MRFAGFGEHLMSRWRSLATFTTLCLSALLLLNCSGSGIPETAGNRVIAFGLEFDQGGQLAIAYEQLCAEVKRSVSFSSFEQSGGAAVSPVLTSDSWILTRNQAVEDYKTLDESVTTAWTDMSVRWPPEGTVPSSTTGTAVWRVHLVREDGLWRVCRFEPSPDQSLRR